MTDMRKIVHANMKALIDWYQCHDAAAETIAARWGHGVSKGTISRKASGSLDWTAADVIALEDAALRYPVTRLLARRLENRPVIESDNLIAQTGSIAKETGEAISAILAAEQSAGADEEAQAIKEIDEAVDALRQARARLSAGAAKRGAV